MPVSIQRIKNQTMLCIDLQKQPVLILNLIDGYFILKVAKV